MIAGFVCVVRNVKIHLQIDNLPLFINAFIISSSMSLFMLAISFFSLLCSVKLYASGLIISAFWYFSPLLKQMGNSNDRPSSIEVG